jgi:hypothetical protein
MVGLLPGIDMIAAEGEKVGFVFPIHGMPLPFPVRRFVSRFNPATTRYLFAVATRAATQHGRSPRSIGYCGGESVGSMLSPL